MSTYRPHYPEDDLQPFRSDYIPNYYHLPPAPSTPPYYHPIRDDHPPSPLHRVPYTENPRGQGRYLPTAPLAPASPPASIKPLSPSPPPESIHGETNNIQWERDFYRPVYPEDCDSFPKSYPNQFYHNNKRYRTNPSGEVWYPYDHNGDNPYQPEIRRGLSPKIPKYIQPWVKAAWEAKSHSTPTTRIPISKTPETTKPKSKKRRISFSEEESRLSGYSPAMLLPEEVLHRIFDQVEHDYMADPLPPLPLEPVDIMYPRIDNSRLTNGEILTYKKLRWKKRLFGMGMLCKRWYFAVQDTDVMQETIIIGDWEGKRAICALDKWIPLGTLDGSPPINLTLQCSYPIIHTIIYMLIQQYPTPPPIKVKSLTILHSHNYENPGAFEEAFTASLFNLIEVENLCLEWYSGLTPIAMGSIDNIARTCRLPLKQSFKVVYKPLEIGPMPGEPGFKPEPLLIPYQRQPIGVGVGTGTQAKGDKGKGKGKAKAQDKDTITSSVPNGDYIRKTLTLAPKPNHNCNGKASKNSGIISITKSFPVSPTLACTSNSSKKRQRAPEEYTPGESISKKPRMVDPGDIPIDEAEIAETQNFLSSMLSKGFGFLSNYIPPQGSSSGSGSGSSQIALQTGYYQTGENISMLRNRDFLEPDYFNFLAEEMKPLGEDYEMEEEGDDTEEEEEQDSGSEFSDTFNGPGGDIDVDSVHGGIEDGQIGKKVIGPTSISISNSSAFAVKAELFNMPPYHKALQEGVIKDIQKEVRDALAQPDDGAIHLLHTEADTIIIAGKARGLTLPTVYPLEWRPYDEIPTKLTQVMLQVWKKSLRKFDVRSIWMGIFHDVKLCAKDGILKEFTYRFVPVPARKTLPEPPSDRKTKMPKLGSTRSLDNILMWHFMSRIPKNIRRQGQELARQNGIEYIEPPPKVDLKWTATIPFDQWIIQKNRTKFKGYGTQDPWQSDWEEIIPAMSDFILEKSKVYIPPPEAISEHWDSQRIFNDMIDWLFTRQQKKISKRNDPSYPKPKQEPKLYTGQLLRLILGENDYTENYPRWIGNHMEEFEIHRRLNSRKFNIFEEEMINDPDPVKRFKEFFESFMPIWIRMLEPEEREEKMDVLKKIYGPKGVWEDMNWPLRHTKYTTVKVVVEKGLR